MLRYQTKQRKRHWLWITRDGSGDGSIIPQSDSHSDLRFRGVRVSFFGKQSKVLVEEILEAGREIQRRKREKYLSVVQVYACRNAW
jgi:hypothetical protein